LWLVAVGATALLLALPWVAREARTPRPVAARVDLANCNGCGRCFADCPYAAVTMGARTDGRPLVSQAIVDADLCAGCGICAGACPSSTPFRSAAELVTGIDLPQAPVAALRATLEAELARLAGSAGGPQPARVIVFGCHAENGGVELAGLSDARTAAIALVCVGQLPPSFVEYALRTHADGVLVTGCREGDCAYRQGNRWTADRLAAERAPRLRAAVPAARVRVAWAGRGQERALHEALAAFRADLALLPPDRAFMRRPKRLEKSDEILRPS
jgi:coenzyme F420-reducing hydrogenase delta subunit/ferredoxin